MTLRLFSSPWMRTSILRNRAITSRSLFAQILRAPCPAHAIVACQPAIGQTHSVKSAPRALTCRYGARGGSSLGVTGKSQFRPPIKPQPGQGCHVQRCHIDPRGSDRSLPRAPLNQRLDAIAHVVTQPRVCDRRRPRGDDHTVPYGQPDPVHLASRHELIDAWQWVWWDLTHGPTRTRCSGHISPPERSHTGSASTQPCRVRRDPH